MSAPKWCRRCGRLLTSPSSYARGIGPICRRRERAAKAGKARRPAAEVVEGEPVLTGFPDLEEPEVVAPQGRKDR